jgi:hypothetical protein
MISATFLWSEATSFGQAIPDEEKWSLIRLYRANLLTQSDWTQLGDAPFTAAQKDAWTAYRQALRDIPQDYPNPDDAMFPEIPA